MSYIVRNYVQSVNPCIETNGRKHNTSQYEHMRRSKNPYLVVRRGQDFQLELKLNNDYGRDSSVITFIFKCREKGRQPSYASGTLVAVTLGDKPRNAASWSVTREKSSQNIVVVNVRPPPTCIVGIWDLEIDTKMGDRHTFTYNNPIYILFNPWCPSDQTFLDSVEWREEAVLNSHGLIWRSSIKDPAYWYFAQFEKDVLDCSIYLMNEIGHVFGTLRSDPITVSRALSQAVNSNDNDNGVLVGNWSGNYDNGTSPTAWTGSMEILQQYYRTKAPVPYAQCWVFAGALTSVCRALGLPSRVITNFSSAHDTDASLTIDVIVDKNGTHPTNDSIWNFHVWSEVWMGRPDLGEDCNGWQTVDATPQEVSGGVYRFGPSSVRACKRGDVLKQFDGHFLFSEVNADVLYWLRDENTGLWKLMEKDSNQVGRDLSTKAPGLWSRLDVTDTYKYPEGSGEERDVFLKALRAMEEGFSRRFFDEDFDVIPTRRVKNEPFHDIVFKFEHLGDVLSGEDFSVSLNMKNKNQDTDHEIVLILRVDLNSYTGKSFGTIKFHSERLVIPRGDEKKIDLNVSYHDYQKLMMANCAFTISCLAEVKGTNHHHFQKKILRVRKPSVEIELQPTATIGQPLVGKMKFTNSLPTALHRGQFVIVAHGLEERTIINIMDEIEPHQTIVRDLKFTPKEPGNYVIAVKFISKELRDANGLHFLVVKK